MDGLHSSVGYGVLFSPLATLADSVTISGSAFERDIPWSLIPGGKLAKESRVKMFNHHLVKVLQIHPRCSITCFLKLSCLFFRICLMDIFKRLINSRWSPSSQEVSTARCLSPGGSVISVPYSETLTVTVSLTDYRVDLPQPCRPSGCFANTFTSFCKYEDHRLGTQDVVPECLGNHSCNSALFRVSFYSCDDAKGWKSFFLGDKM